MPCRYATLRCPVRPPGSRNARDTGHCRCPRIPVSSREPQKLQGSRAGRRGRGGAPRAARHKWGRALAAAGVGTPLQNAPRALASAGLRLCGMRRLPAARAGTSAWRRCAIGHRLSFSLHPAPPGPRRPHCASPLLFPRGGSPHSAPPPNRRAHCGPPWPHCVLVCSGMPAGTAAPRPRVTLVGACSRAGRAALWQDIRRQ